MRLPAIAACTVLVLSGCAASGISGASDAALSHSNAGGSGKPVAGMVGGGLVMSAGARLTPQEQISAIDAEYRALESTPAGQPVEWRGERAGYGGIVTAAQPYRVGSQDCRPYSHVLRSGNQPLSLRGTACRNPDGSWTLLN